LAQVQEPGLCCDEAGGGGGLEQMSKIVDPNKHVRDYLFITSNMLRLCSML
jgi:hypothetical protein